MDQKGIRELRVVMLVAGGWANKQIARHKKINEWTISTHLGVSLLN
ncbi:MAG: response regulator transcription factor [Candidatus Brocadia sp.]|nr:response regulator transcription factor [Candidatus Brocadia sp.]MDG6025225.1 response regulator transcription factor [Candidatus Brocadia sp.]